MQTGGPQKGQGAVAPAPQDFFFKILGIQDFAYISSLINMILAPQK